MDPVSRRHTLLIVEDDVALRRICRMALVFSGFDVHEAGDGYEALVRLDQHPPDAVILDLGLPIINGMDVRTEIAAHSHLRHIPIVVMTGSAENLDGLDVPCVLRKPIETDDLVVAVRRCLASARPRVAEGWTGDQPQSPARSRRVVPARLSAKQ